MTKERYKHLKELLAGLLAITIIGIFLQFFFKALILQASVEFIKSLLVVISISIIGSSFAGFSIQEDSKFSDIRKWFFVMGLISIASIISCLFYLTYPSNKINFLQMGLISFIASFIYLIIIFIWAIQISNNKGDN